MSSVAQRMLGKSRSKQRTLEVFSELFTKPPEGVRLHHKCSLASSHRRQWMTNPNKELRNI
jgi:hypothetical protein